MCYFWSTLGLPATPNFHRSFAPPAKKSRRGFFPAAHRVAFHGEAVSAQYSRPVRRACAYKTASGLGKWPNRDPFGEKGFMVIKFPTWDIIVETTLGANIYEMVDNCPVGKF